MNPPLLPYRDRKGGLIVFGFFTVLIGLCCAALVPLMIFGQAFAPQTGAPAREMSILPAVFIYGLLAVALIWLGVGSMMARRWARALLLIASWSGLLVGLMSITAIAFIMPQMTEVISAGQPGKTDPATARVIMLIPLIFVGILFVMIPAIWVFFYRSPHVKATCETLDPVERWTDRSPLPVLAICLWLAWTAPMMVMTGFAYRGVVPFFGTIVTGPAGTGIYLLLAAVWSFCAWSLYRLESRGWWTLLVSFVLFSLSAFITYSRHDIGEVYRMMGYSAAMLAEMEKYNFFKGSRMAWMSLVGLPPIIGYLLFVRKYLRRS